MIAWRCRKETGWTHRKIEGIGGQTERDKIGIIMEKDKKTVFLELEIIDRGLWKDNYKMVWKRI